MKKRNNSNVAIHTPLYSIASHTLQIVAEKLLKRKNRAGYIVQIDIGF